MLSKDELLPKTLAQWISLFPYASIAAIILAALFNVGYFIPVGVHFLGLMDFSNFVYSLGIAFVVVTFGFCVALLISEFGIRRIAGAGSSLVLFGLVIVCVVLMFLILGGVIPKQAVPVEYVMLVGAFALFVRSAVNSVFYLQLHRPNTTSHIATIITLVLSTVMAGGASSIRVISGDRTRAYRFELKGSYEVLAAKVLRSSSSGFLIVVGREIIYLPKEEVRRVSYTPAYFS